MLVGQGKLKATHFSTSGLNTVLALMVKLSTLWGNLKSSMA